MIMVILCFEQIFHSDYFSGWDEQELQTVLDNCENDSEAAMPTAYCSDWLTFRGKGKTEGVQVDDDEIREDLEKIQPDPIDIKGTICAEEVTNVPEVPRESCTGTLIPAWCTCGNQKAWVWLKRVTLSKINKEKNTLKL